MTARWQKKLRTGLHWETSNCMGVGGNITFDTETMMKGSRHTGGKFGTGIFLCMKSKTLTVLKLMVPKINFKKCMDSPVKGCIVILKDFWLFWNWKNN